MNTSRHIHLLLVLLLVASLLGGCGRSQPTSELTSEKTPSTVPVFHESNTDEHPLKGKKIEMTILGIGEWFPSELSGRMAARFSKYAKEKYGYDVSFSFVGSPAWSLFGKASASLAIGSQEFNIIIIDSQWLGAFAEPGWIVNVNGLIKKHPELNIEWWDPIITETYMEYPMGSGRLWGFPQEADVIVLFVRTDLLGDPAERKAFKSLHNMDLPQTFEDFVDLSMKDFEKVAEFFTRPGRDLYGTVMQYSEKYDFMTVYLYPFMFSLGGEIWDPKDQRIYGVINSDVNAEAMRWNRRMLAYQPPDAIHYGISENRDAFVQGKVATAFQWAAMGLAMITEENRDKVLVVPPPGFRQKDGSLRRIYSIGGQPWVINASNDESHMRVAVEFLQWWYLPQTQLEFARRGGNPSVKATLQSPGFDELQPWFRAMKYMLTANRSKDFWHHPKYAKLLEVQQEAFTAYASGRIDDPAVALEYIACRQQQILFESGSSKDPPPDSCADVILK